MCSSLDDKLGKLDNESWEKRILVGGWYVVVLCPFRVEVFGTFWCRVKIRRGEVRKIIFQEVRK